MRLIDADELNERFESSCTTECACCHYSDDNCGLVHEADTVNAIVIPKNATNGDMIKALFPEIETTEFAITIHATEKVVCNGVKGGISYDFWKEWWNTPYKTESEESDETK